MRWIPALTNCATCCAVHAHNHAVLYNTLTMLFGRKPKPTPPFPFPPCGEQPAASLLPLAPAFRFVHEPLMAGSALQFVGRAPELKELTMRILFSNGGSFLVTGYRGVGKTSFINEVLSSLSAALPWAEPIIGSTTILNVQMSLARPLEPVDLMHYILRKLYEVVKENKLMPLLPSELLEDLTEAHDRTLFQITRKNASAGEASVGGPEIGFGRGGFIQNIKIPFSYKRTKSRERQLTTSAYDERMAEHDIVRLSHAVARGFDEPSTIPRWLRSIFHLGEGKRTRVKIIFVFDELDKLGQAAGAEGIDAKVYLRGLLGSLKNVLTTSGISFVFVAGRDLYELWQQDAWKGDSVYESVFSYDKYLPCLWDGVDGICNQFLDSDTSANAQPGMLTASDFRKYLAFVGRGIPRRVLRAFNSHVEWSEDRIALAFSRQDCRRIACLAKLCDLLSENAEKLFGDAIEQIAPTHRDQRRLGVYYVVDWVLRQGRQVFTAGELAGASRQLSENIALGEGLRPNVIQALIDVMVAGSFLEQYTRARDYLTILALSRHGAQRPASYRLTPEVWLSLGGLDPGLYSEPGATEEEPRRTRIGHFEVVRILASGGFAQLFEAIDLDQHRTVALKVFRGQSDTSFAQLALDYQIEIFRALRHPNIVQYYESDPRNDPPYIAMQLVKGASLQNAIRAKGPFETPVATKIGFEIAAALSYLHSLGLVRHDLKPANILLEDDGTVYLCDFDTTYKVGEPPPGPAGGIMGTLAYMAPEQFNEASPDERVDIYSFGVVLYEMIRGRPPFIPTNDDVAQIVDEKNKGLPAEEQEFLGPMYPIIRKCLNPDPSGRYAKMDDVICDMMLLQMETSTAHVVDLPKEVHRVQREEREETGEFPMPDVPVARRTLAISRDDARVALIAALDAQPRIEIIRPDRTTQIHKLTGREVRIGRSGEADVVVDEKQASRIQVIVTPQGGAYYIRDIHSINGTLLNGERLQPGDLYPLHDGDQVRIGATILKFHAIDSSEADSVAAPHSQ